MQGLSAFYADESSMPCIEAVARLIGVPVEDFNNEKHWPIFIAKEAVKQANALIAALNAEESK